jgi:hypothetical protein
LLAGSTHEHARHSLRKPDQDFVRLPGTTFVDQYTGYVTILAALAPVAFVVTEASRWVDLSAGRVEVQLSIAGSRSRVVLEWALSAVAGIIVVSLALIAGCMVGAASAGVELRADSLMRTTAALGVGFFVSVLAPVFRWSAWVVRLSPSTLSGRHMRLYLDLPASRSWRRLP